MQGNSNSLFLKSTLVKNENKISRAVFMLRFDSMPNWSIG